MLFRIILNSFFLFEVAKSTGIDGKEANGVAIIDLTFKQSRFDAICLAMMEHDVRMFNLARNNLVSFQFA